MNKIDKMFKHLVNDLNENVTDYPRKELSKDIWDKNKKLKPEIKKELLKRFDLWQTKMFPNIKIKNRYILGSITTFQYNSSSDIDINIIVSNPKSEVDKVWKTLPNGNTIGDHPVNYYVSANTHDVDMSKTLYDLDTDTWIKEPTEKQIKMPEKYSLEIAKFFMDGIDLRISEYERDTIELKRLQELLKDNNSFYEEDELKEEIAKKEQEIKADKDAIKLAHYLIKALRKEGFKDEEYKFKFDVKIENDETDPNTSLNNLIYKNLEKYGYLEKIEEIK